MTIARLIAEMPDREIRLDALRADLREKPTPIDVLMTRGGDTSVTEIQIDALRLDQMNSLLDTHFPCSDRIVCGVPEQIEPFMMDAIPNLVVSDMDSTMIGQECIDELADYAGIKDQIAVITERAMQGEIDFEDALRERVALLAGLEESAIARCLEERIRPNPGAVELIRALKAKGARTVLVTGGFHHFADRVAQQIGFDRVVGNRLAVKDGKLTGELDGPVSDATTKASVLAEETARLGEGAVSLALGDGANDIPMIEAATYGIAYMAKPKAKAAADGRIESGNLANVLALLGVDSGRYKKGF
ncbi:MAG: phosphoserine phosphatase SerB [Pseudomonadota bacterium]